MNQKFWDYATILNSKLKNSSEKLNQEGISVSQISSHVVIFLYVERVEITGDCSLCWYWLNRWASLFLLSFHKTIIYITLLRKLDESEILRLRYYSQLKTKKQLWKIEPRGNICVTNFHGYVTFVVIAIRCRNCLPIRSIAKFTPELFKHHNWEI
jgi:hypothetical protein